MRADCGPIAGKGPLPLECDLPGAITYCQVSQPPLIDMAVCEVRKTVTMSRKDQDQRPGDAGSDIVTETRPKTKKPSLYKVLLLNDDYTPMEFVVYILESFFNKSQEDATRVMLHVHQKGVGICGVYTFEVAETKVAQVMNFSQQNDHPLQCTMEQE